MLNRRYPVAGNVVDVDRALVRQVNELHLLVLHVGFIRAVQIERVRDRLDSSQSILGLARCHSRGAERERISRGVDTSREDLEFIPGGKRNVTATVPGRPVQDRHRVVDGVALVGRVCCLRIRGEVDPQPLTRTTAGSVVVQITGTGPVLAVDKSTRGVVLEIADN